METQKVNDVLNDLIRINNDRVEGYTKASENLDAGNEDLLSIFDRYKKQSAEFANHLRNEVQLGGGKAATDTTISGKLYRGWMEFKATLSGDKRHNVLESCEAGEDAAQKAYNDALSKDIPGNIRALITTQKEELNIAHNEIKSLRDSSKMHA